jgi:hypothetical protein
VRVSRLGPAAAQQHNSPAQKEKEKDKGARNSRRGRPDGRNVVVCRKKKKNYSPSHLLSYQKRKAGHTNLLISPIRAAHNISKQSRLSVLLRRRFRSLAKGLFRSLSSSSW